MSKVMSKVMSKTARYEQELVAESRAMYFPAEQAKITRSKLISEVNRGLTDEIAVVLVCVDGR